MQQRLCWPSLHPCHHLSCPLLLRKSVMCVYHLPAQHPPCWLTPYPQQNGLSSGTLQVLKPNWLLLLLLQSLLHDLNILKSLMAS